MERSRAERSDSAEKALSAINREYSLVVLIFSTPNHVAARTRSQRSRSGLDDRPPRRLIRETRAPRCPSAGFTPEGRPAASAIPDDRIRYPALLLANSPLDLIAEPRGSGEARERLLRCGLRPERRQALLPVRYMTGSASYKVSRKQRLPISRTRRADTKMKVNAPSKNRRQAPEPNRRSMREMNWMPLKKGTRKSPCLPLPLTVLASLPVAPRAAERSVLTNPGGEEIFHRTVGHNQVANTLLNSRENVYI